MLTEIKPLTSEITLPSAFEVGRGQGAETYGTPQEYVERTPSNGEPADPFDVTVQEGDTEGTYVAIVSRGVVLDHVQETGDSVIQIEVPNQYDGAFDDGLARFPIVDGGKVYVATWINEFGAVDADANPAVGGDSCEILVWAPGDDPLVSVHYVPPVGDDLTDVSGGVRFYMLAKFDIVADGSMRITPGCMGDNIVNYRETPAWYAPGTDGVNHLTKFNPALGWYENKRTRAKVESGSPSEAYEGPPIVQIKVESVPESDAPDAPRVVEISATLKDSKGGPMGGGTGTHEIFDCWGTRISFLEWRNGSILTNGAQQISLVDCDGGFFSSSPSSLLDYLFDYSLPSQSQYYMLTF